MIENMRPQVTTSYTITPVNPLSGGRGIGIIANVPIGNGEAYMINSLPQAKELLNNSDEKLLNMIKTLYAISSAKIVLIGMQEDTDENFITVLNLLMQQDDIYIILPQTISQNRSFYLKEILEKGALVKKEKIAVIPSIEDVCVNNMAKDINCERIFISYPKIHFEQIEFDVSASILAGFISKNQAMHSNLNGENISGDFNLATSMTEDEINMAIADGVCVFEQITNYIELIRGVTTKTMDNDGTANRVFRNLSTIIMIDTIVPIIRDTIARRLEFLRNSPTSISSVISLIECELSNFVDEQVLSEYEKPVVEISIDDPSVMLVDLAFTVAQGINQVKISCHISV